MNVRLTRGPDVPDDGVHPGRIEPSGFPAGQVVFIDSAMGTHVERTGRQITGPDDCAAAGRLPVPGGRSARALNLVCSRRLTDDEAARPVVRAGPGPAVRVADIPRKVNP
ncbi:hypothetical protein [Actinoallomurus acaciae]|uniref:Uncharacterized protein n=1 Tax=Actinoallomurus acaciae TaxID=502577 RepID=A0ABV5YAE8_9ACTN